MSKLKFILVGTICAASFLNAGQVSVFGAGNLGSSNPYGLTKGEDATYENQQKISALEQKIEGLQTVISGLSEQISDLQNKFNNLNRARLQKKNYKPQQIEAKIQKHAISFQKMSYVEIKKKAYELFSKKQYDDAIKMYDYLVNKKYDLTYSSYMLGECFYFKKMYALAIKEYKLSLSSYKPSLLSENNFTKLIYHIGISFSKLGKKDIANNFFNTLKEQYPNSMEAKWLKKHENKEK